MPQYEGSELDTLLNENYYKTLSDAVKDNIQIQSIAQNIWKYAGATADVALTDLDDHSYALSKVGTVGTYSRNVYALDIQDVVDYLGSDITGAQLNTMLFGTEKSFVQNVWLRSARPDDSVRMFLAGGNIGCLSVGNYDISNEARPTFTITLK